MLERNAKNTKTNKDILKKIKTNVNKYSKEMMTDNRAYIKTGRQITQLNNERDIILA